MNKTLHFAIVGCGRIAPRHAGEIMKHGKLAAVCDIQKIKADKFASEFGAKPYYCIDDLIAAEKELDIIVICTPNGLHAEHSIKSLNAGLHVLCEKPMAIRKVDALDMIAAANKNERKLFVVKQNRFNPPVLFVKNMLSAGKLGKIASFQLNCFWNRPDAYYQDTWKGKKELDGGTLYTQFSHFIDILYWFLGDVKSVKGMRKNELHTNSIEFEDTGAAILEMESGVIGSLNYTINAYGNNMEGSLTLFGEKGTIKVGGQYLNELEYFSVENEAMPALYKSNPANQYGFYEGSMSNHDKVYENLISAFSQLNHSSVSAEEAYKTIEIIENIYTHSSF